MFKRRLAREVALAVALKVLLLSLIYSAFFGSAHRLRVTGAEAAGWLLSTAPTLPVE